MMAQTVFHMDMDAFYASIEERDHPEYRGKPLIVGGTSRRGVVATCNYVAREYGLHSAQPMSKALRLCPDAICVSPRIGYYSEISKTIMGILKDYSPTIEPLSLDEAFMDMTGTEELFGPPVEAAQAIKDSIREATQLTCSIGIAPNKFLAKFASDLDKPDGITVVPRGGEAEFIAPFPIRKIWGVGPKSAEKLEELELYTIGDVAAADIVRLRQELGKSFADHVHTLAQGLDARKVVADRTRKSVGSERTLSNDVRGRPGVEPVLREQCENVAKTLRKKGFRARGIRVKVRYSATFSLATRQGPLPGPTDDSRTLFEHARGLLESLELDEPMRLVGAAAFDLKDPDEPEQLGLFSAVKRKNENLERAIDAIEDRVGAAVRRGSQVAEND